MLVISSVDGWVILFCALEDCVVIGGTVVRSSVFWLVGGKADC